MGYTLPGWLDDVLDFIGINFPNVDEDDYREMATAMRDFADKFEGHGADAHKAVERVLSTSHGWAVDSMEKHWSQVKAGHLDKVPELARLFADACDIIADIVFGMKTKAEAELAVMAGSIGASAALAVFTGGLSALFGAAEVTALRQVVKRLIDEAVDRIVDELIARVSEPVNAKLEAMVEDMVLNLAEGAFSLPPDSGTGPGGMRLASAGGAGGMQLASASGSGAMGDLHIDHEEFESGAGKLSFHGNELHLNSSAALGRAKGAFGRTHGKDPFTQTFDSILEGGLHGCAKAVDKIGHHLAEVVPDRTKAVSRKHRDTDDEVGQAAKRVKTEKDGDGKDVRTYLLSTDGDVRRLHTDGGLHDLDETDRNRLHGVLDADGRAWRPQTRRHQEDTKVPNTHPDKVVSTKVDPYTDELGKATQLARYARNDYDGNNYAAGRYIDPDGRGTSILVGYSEDGMHSERSIGYPLLHRGTQKGLSEVFTERQPCQKKPSCDRWLNHRFPDTTTVHHTSSYDQSLPRHVRDKEHKAYRLELKAHHGR
ncbi:nucleic acid/nucleotide deaminase domain-containing protein [Streptomyces sp. NPDC005573]